MSGHAVIGRLGDATVDITCADGSVHQLHPEGRLLVTANDVLEVTVHGCYHDPGQLVGGAYIVQRPLTLIGSVIIVYDDDVTVLADGWRWTPEHGAQQI